MQDGPLPIFCLSASAPSIYGPGVESLTMTEPEVPLVRRLERKARELAPQATVLRARPRISPSRTARSTLPSRPWCCVAWTTSRALCGS